MCLHTLRVLEQLERLDYDTHRLHKTRRTYTPRQYSTRAEGWSARQHRRRYRMSKETFDGLVSTLTAAGLGKRKRKGRVSKHSPAARVSMMLRYLAGAHVCDIADTHDLYDDSVYRIVYDAMECLCRCISLPRILDPTELQRAGVSFQAKPASAEFPGLIGAIDGLYISIVPPARNAAQYVSYKGGHSLNLQAVCDAKARFTWFSMHSPGGTHDGLAFRLSNLCTAMREGKMPPECFIVGDAAYSSCAAQLLTPYNVKKAKLPIEEDAFNFFQSSHRVVIERAFGLLVGRCVHTPFSSRSPPPQLTELGARATRRWGILWRPLQSPKAATQRLIVESIIRLHNLCQEAHAELTVSAEARMAEQQQHAEWGLKAAAWRRERRQRQGGGGGVAAAAPHRAAARRSQPAGAPTQLPDGAAARYMHAAPANVSGHRTFAPAPEPSTAEERRDAIAAALRAACKRRPGR